MARPETIQACNTHSCTETRCDENNYICVREGESCNEGCSYTTVYEIVWDGQRIKEWTENGYRYDYGGQVSFVRTTG